MHTQHGLAFAISAFLLWGLAPVFFKLVSEVNAFEVLAHRVVWSVVILALVLGIQRKWSVFRELSWAQYKRLLLSALFVSTNWLIFIWAVSVDRVLETSLGYFINPLISVFLGLIFLGERLRTFQWIALTIAAVGVSLQIWQFGSIPWVALGLAFSFAFYGLIRKSMPIEPISGLFVETILLLPFAIAYLIYLAAEGLLVFGTEIISMDLVLIASGLMTTIPLLLFAAATNRLPLTTIGIVQYLTPTMTFFLAVFLYREPFDLYQLMSFSLIWFALLLFTIEMRLSIGR